MIIALTQGISRVAGSRAIRANLGKLMLNKSLTAAALVIGCFATLAVTAPAASGHDRDDGPLTYAIIGDWPYSQTLLANAHLLIDSIDSDRDVSRVVHVGDIHSGSMPCTSAGILPPIPKSDPGWNQEIFWLFQQFEHPVVYLPGDNEWSDCHKTKQFSSGAPLQELASVRQLFFSRPGRTLGQHAAHVWTQAEHFDDAHPEDSQFVENVMWSDSQVLFATFNIPGGSNDDTAPWTGTFANPDAQAEEMAQREGANLRWLDRAFEAARGQHAKAVVIAVQADLWDPEAIAPGGAGLDKYTPFVQALAAAAIRFRKPVLLLNGDTHLFLADHPLSDPASVQGKIHNTPAVPNLTRIVVQGSTNAPAEWLRLVIDTRKSQPFSWSNVPYCADPNGSCQ